MRVHPYVTILALAASAAGAQDKAPANAPAGKTSPGAPGNAPSAPAPSPAAPKALAVRVPSGGQYTAYIQEDRTGAPKTIQDKGELTPPADVASYTVYVLDPQSGYAARKTVDTKAAPAEISFAAPDFKLVQKVRIKATGKGDKPISRGTVMLTDGAKNTSRDVIDPSSQGAVEFKFVVSGKGSVTVTPEGGTATTKEISLDLPKGETAQTIPVAMPEVTATVEPAPEAAAAANAPAANGPAPPAPAQPAQPAVQPAQPVQPVAPAQPAQPLPPPASDGGFGSNLIGFLFLAAVLFAAYHYMKNKGITVEDLLKKLGVQPDTAVSSAGAAGMPGGPPAPGPAPAPPPIVSDPNQCPFCGQMKDPSGACACTVTPGASAPASAYGAVPGGYGAGPAGGTGPRLVGMAGTYMGQVFPISGIAVIGREATNPVPLDRDTTASRRHAQISDQGGTYVIQDLGSANGTFVNGARVTEAALRSGDEVSIGGTRFRFEV